MGKWKWQRIEILRLPWSSFLKNFHLSRCKRQLAIFKWKIPRKGWVNKFPNQIVYQDDIPSFFCPAIWEFLFRLCHSAPLHFFLVLRRVAILLSPWILKKFVFQCLHRVTNYQASRPLEESSLCKAARDLHCCMSWTRTGMRIAFFNLTCCITSRFSIL